MTSKFALSPLWDRCLSAANYEQSTGEKSMAQKASDLPWSQAKKFSFSQLEIFRSLMFLFDLGQWEEEKIKCCDNPCKGHFRDLKE